MLTRMTLPLSRLLATTPRSTPGSGMSPHAAVNQT
jgi:hypothetical protein